MSEKSVLAKRITRFKKENNDTHCHYCKREFGEGLASKTVDHKIPKTKGGHSLSYNFVMACKRCNLWKGGKDYEVFLELLPKYLKRIEEVPDTKMRYGRPVLPIIS